MASLLPTRLPDKRPLNTDLPRGYKALVLTLSSFDSASLFAFYEGRSRIVNYYVSPSTDLQYRCRSCEAAPKCNRNMDVVYNGECVKGYTYSQLGNASLEATVPGYMWNYALRSGDLKLFAWRERGNELDVTPYSYANVYNDGSICWGGNSPKTIDEAERFYWVAPFNADLTRGEADFLGHLKQWRPTGWQTSTVMSRATIIRTKPAEGLVIGRTASLLNGIPEEYLHQDVRGNYLVAWRRNTESGVILAVTHPNKKYDLIVSKKRATTKGVSVLGTSKDFPDLV